MTPEQRRCNNGCYLSKKQILKVQKRQAQSKLEDERNEPGKVQQVW